MLTGRSLSASLSSWICIGILWFLDISSFLFFYGNLFKALVRGLEGRSRRSQTVVLSPFTCFEFSVKHMGSKRWMSQPLLVSLAIRRRKLSWGRELFWCHKLFGIANDLGFAEFLGIVNFLVS